MSIISLKCPSCGARLQADPGNETLVCKYCGANSVMKDAIVQNYIQAPENIVAEETDTEEQKDFAINGSILKK